MKGLHEVMQGSFWRNLLSASRKWTERTVPAANLDPGVSMGPWGCHHMLRRPVNLVSRVLDVPYLVSKDGGTVDMKLLSDLRLGSYDWGQRQDKNFSRSVSPLIKQTFYRSLEIEKLDITASRSAEVDASIYPVSAQHQPLWSQSLPGSSSMLTSKFCGTPIVWSGSDIRGIRDFKNLPKELSRGFAKTVAVPPQMQKPIKLRLYMGSPGVIGEPYKKPPPRLPLLRRWFTKEGWKRRKQYFMGTIKTSYTIAKLRQKTKGYSQQRFYQEVSDLYKQINVALAEGERTKLRHLVTDSVFSGMKNELKHRESAWAKVRWELVGPINKIRTLQGRLIAVDKNNKDNAFVQMTLRILSKQKFAAYDKHGKLVAGDPERELLVEDYWVFEKPLLVTEAKWLLCGRLSL